MIEINAPLHIPREIQDAILKIKADTGIEKIIFKGSGAAVSLAPADDQAHPEAHRELQRLFKEAFPYGLGIRPTMFNPAAEADKVSV